MNRNAVVWWSRWLVLHSHRTAWHRLVTCRTEHRGPMYDAHVCLTCGKDICS